MRVWCVVYGVLYINLLSVSTFIVISRVSRVSTDNILFRATIKMSTISKSQLLFHFTKIDSYNYKCKTCNRTYKTPNGGIGNMKVHFATHLKNSSYKVVLGKRKLQTGLLPFVIYAEVDNPDECQTVHIVSIFNIFSIKCVH